jgi:YegS/Rv2252/BmrU family lipid kinase
MARAAVRDAWPLIVAVGGDGTVNEVVNGLLDKPGDPVSTLGTIMTGRGRDLCRNLAVPSVPELAADRLARGADVLVDVGMAEWGVTQRRFFLSAAGAGFDAVVAQRAEALGGSGTVPYVWALLGALGSHRAVSAEIRVDGRPAWAGALTTAVVANGAFYGGGMMIAPSADPTDGSLDLVVIGALGRAELLRWLPRLYRGTHLANSRVTVYRGTTFEIVTTPPVPTHVDGEAGPPTPVRITIRERALRLRR